MDSDIQRLKLINWLIIGRLVILTILLAITYIGAHFSKHNILSIDKLSLLLGAAFLFTAIYGLWARWKKGINLLIWSQIILDVLLVTLAVYWTGQARSPFAFLYPLVIVSASLLMGRTGGTTSAVLSTIAFAIMCLWLTPSDPNQSLFTFFLNMAAFNITAALGVMLAQRLKHTQIRLSEAQIDLRRIGQIQRHLARNLRSGLITVDTDLRITSYNQAAIEILKPHIDITNTYGKPLEEVWSDAAQLIIETNQHTQDRNEIKIQDQEGNTTYLGISLFPLSDDQDKNLGYGLIFQDITEIKAREERLQRMDKLAALGEMAAGLAHEIRNPLASLCGAAQFLHETGLIQPEGERLLNIISREAERLNRLTETFLLYARPERRAGENVSIKNEVEAIVDLISRRKGLAPCKFEIDIPDNLNIIMDPDQLRQVLLNLLLNARQALASEGGIVHISARLIQDNIELIIKDNGKGISPRDLKHIFDPFFTTKADGTGLGLAVVHRLIQAHNGDIQVTSQEGKGTSFIIHIPVNELPVSTDKYNNVKERDLSQAGTFVA